MAYRLPTGLVEMSGGCVSVLVSWYALLGSAWAGSVGVRVTSLPEGDAGMLSVGCGNACFGLWRDWLHHHMSTLKELCFHKRCRC